MEMVGLYEIEIPKSEAPAFALADAQIQEGDPAANTSYATTTTTTNNNNNCNNNWYRQQSTSQSSFTRNFSLIQHTNFSRTPAPLSDP